MGLFCLWEWKGARLPIVPSASFLLARSNVGLTMHDTLSVYIQACHRHGSIHCYVCQVRPLDRSMVGIEIDSWSRYSGMVFYSSLFYLPQFFQVALGYSPIRSGIFLFPVLVSQTLMSALAVRIVSSSVYVVLIVVSLQGQIVSRTGRYRVCVILIVGH